MCGTIDSGKRKVLAASNVFSAEAAVIHNDAYDYTLVEYVNATTNVQIICRYHGIFLQTPSNHKNGTGCPACALYGFNKAKPAILYHLKISFNGNIAFKIGITNRSVQDRFNNTDLLKIQVLKIWEFPIGADAVSREKEILALYQEYRYTDDPLLSSGNTELFYIDVLGLDVIPDQE